MLKFTKKKQLSLLVVMVFLVTTIFSSSTPIIASTSGTTTKENIASIKFAYTADEANGIYKIPSTLPYTNNSLGITVSTNATYEENTSTSATALRAAGWGVDKYWQFDFSPVGFENYTISFAPRSSGTGPRDFKLQYSTDNISWQDVAGATYSVTTSYTNTKTFDLPTEIRDLSNLYIRMVVNSNISVNATDTTVTTIQPGGVSNIGNIVLSGTRISGGNTPVVLPVVSNYPSYSQILKTDPITLSSPSVVSGGAVVVSGGAVAVSGAAIQFSVNNSPFTTYTGPFTLEQYGASDTNTDFAITAYAEVDGIQSIATAYYYTIKVPESNTVPDPISDEMITSSGASSIKALYEMATGGTATVIGQVAYKYGNVVSGANSINTIILQDVIDGQIIGFQIFDSANQYTIGDIVTVTGTVSVYGGVRQIKTVTAVNKIATAPPFAPQEKTIAELIAGGDNYLSEYVLIKNAMLGSYNVSGNTPIIDGTGIVNLFKGALLPGGIVTGDQINLYAAWSKYNTNYQLRNGDSTDYMLVAPRTEAPSISPVPGPAHIGDEIALTTPTEGTMIYYSFDGLNYSVYDSNNKPKITILPVTISIYATKIGFSNSLPNSYTYTQTKVEPVLASPNGGARAIGSKVQLSCATEGATIQYSMDGGATWMDYNTSTMITLDTLPVTITAKAVKTDFEDSDVSSFDFTQRLNQNYNIYFGQIHSHTNYSDGTGTCEQAFDYAKNTAKQIDFLAVTDHSNTFDNDSSANIADGSVSQEWKEGHALADKYTDSSFVAIYGYEMTWSNGLGHMNTFNTPGFQSRNQVDYGTYSTALQNYYNTLKTQPQSISQFNHPGAQFGDFSDFDHYDAATDYAISLIEVGNGEGLVGSSSYFPSYEYYTRALDKGWHLAPTNNQDNHKGLWGDANTARTVVLADSLTRDDIYDALKNMRTYATEDDDLSIYYTLNGEIMGTVMSTTPETAAIEVQLSDPTDASIGKVEVIVNGGLSIAEQTVNTNNQTVKFNLPTNYSYYYIKVTEADNDIAVTAPVWVKDIESVGISKISTTAVLPVKGEAFDVKTELYNNEEQDLEIQSIEYTLDDQVIHSVDLTASGLTKLTSHGTANYQFNYTYDGVGNKYIIVTMKATLNGVEKVYQGVLSLNFVDPSMVTNVIIDGTHYNDYVTGYYGGNMNNFTRIAADENIKVNIIKDKITDATLSNCDLLIISAPAKKTGTANAGPYVVSHFDDEFIAAVKTYTEKGGTVILCGLADYQDTTNGQSSTEINKLLQAIGATTRINSDEAVDDVDNGGQNYRLYLTDYNTNSMYAKDIVSGQKYSAYSGCTVLVDSTAVQNGKVEYLVKGHPTTYSIDSKQLDSNYTQINQGDAIMLAREQLASGSNVFIASTVFMSDYEVKAAIDNSLDLPYSNKTIMVNILDSIKKQMNVSTIASVRTGNKGDIYCVEGIVTAGTVSGNAFFDTIYIQDPTGGINIFPINQGLIEVGQKVKVLGYLDEYLGDKELRVIQATVIDTAKMPLNPTLVTTKEAMDYTTNGGKLAKVTGVITDVIQKNGVVETIKLKDSSGVEARIFVDGYINYSDATSAKLEGIALIGNTISAVGLVSYDTEGQRLRVRDRSEIILISTAGSNDTNNNTNNNGTTGNTNETTGTTNGPTNTITYDKEKNTATVNCNTNEVSQNNGIANIQVSLLPNTFDAVARNSSGEAPLNVIINVPTETIMKQLDNNAVTEVNLNIMLPSTIQNNSNININNMLVDQSIINKMKEEQKDITIVVSDENAKELYSWSFDGAELKESNNAITDINVSLQMKPVKEVSEITKLLRSNISETSLNKGFVIDFNHSGILPSTATVRVYVGRARADQEGIKPGDTVYVYYYNDLVKEGARLDEGNSVAAIVDANGYITIQIDHCSSYVILPEKPNAKIVATIFEQISILAKKTIYIGKSYMLTVHLPVEVDHASITYSSSNKAIATISKDGKITPKKAGTVTISTKITINGVMKVFKTKVTVKKPYVSLTAKTTSIKVGETFIFKAKAYGVTGTITWESSNKSIATISKSGKLVAKKAGKVTIKVKVNNVTKTIVVTVKSK